MNSDDTNVYNCDTLNNEVWEEPITKIPKKCGVSNLAVHKVYKPNHIPKLPIGYWTN